MAITEAREHTFDTIAGQDLVKRFLINVTERGRVPQGLLFSGPPGVGKRSLMYAFAKYLAASEHEAGSAGAERAYSKIARGIHPDVLVVEPRSASGQILREQIDEMHDRAHYAPLESPYRIILISPVEAMNVVAANNLLKLLEEPPKTLRILLACQQFHRVLPTIRSRCAIVRCPPLEFDALTEWIAREARCTQTRASAYARLSGGRPGAALALASGKDEQTRRSVKDQLDFFHREGYLSVFAVARNLLDAAGGTERTLEILTSWFRDQMVSSLFDGEAADEVKALLVNTDMMDEVAEAAGRYAPAGLAAALETIMAEQRQVRPMIDADLQMQVLLTRLGIALKRAA